MAERARFLSEEESRRELVKSYMVSVGAAQSNMMTRLFKWDPAFIQSAVQQLEKRGVIQTDLELEGQTGQWIAVLDLITP
jgi:hypothetical protein